MPAPSPPGLKSSIEYFAMSVGIGRTLYGPPSLLGLLDHENIERVTAPNDHQNEPTMLRQPKCFYFVCWKKANMTSSQLPESEKEALFNSRH